MWWRHAADLWLWKSAATACGIDLREIRARGNVIQSLWRSLKTWRHVRLGPVSLTFKLQRAVRITRGAHKRRRVERQRDEPPVDAVDSRRELAVIVGVGPGFGFALARVLAAQGFDLVLVSRDASRLSALGSELSLAGCAVSSYGADATDELSIGKVFDSVAAVHGAPALVVYSLQYSGPGRTVDVELPAFELSWRHNCLGAFLVGRCAARLMTPRGRGTIVLVGSTSSLIGREDHLNLAVGKFGQRALAQVMARELWPLGIHVVHAIVDADIAEGSLSLSAPQADPRDVASAVIGVHRQPKTAWTSELDLRPWNERFWEHC
jgi:NAD(P)-dependent dehydrogenase (short-subunit alcohol dehydrogenase family)